jgi:hypothetical protein
MRIWIHSHPFSTTKPSPSGTDNTTLEEKTGIDSEWAVMVIVGQGPTFARLHIRPALLDNEAIEMDIEVEVDWALLATSKVRKEWKKEFDRNIKEKPEPEPIPARSTQKGWHQGSYISGNQKGNQGFQRLVQDIKKDKKNKKGKKGKKGKQPLLTGYQREFYALCSTDTDLKITYTPGDLTLPEFQAARRKGFTTREIFEWGDFVMVNTPAALRNSDENIRLFTPQDEVDDLRATHVAASEIE